MVVAFLITNGVYMMLSAAELLEALERRATTRARDASESGGVGADAGDLHKHNRQRKHTKRILALREAAANVTRMLLSKAWSSTDNGAWRTLYPTGKSKVHRHVLDFMYISRLGALLPPDVRASMVAFAKRELIVKGPTLDGIGWQWVTAMSFDDSESRQHDISIRPDHGYTGSYSAWPALTAEGLASLDALSPTDGSDEQSPGRGWGDWSPNGALALLRGVAVLTREGPFGQAHELRTSGLPPSDELSKDAAPPFKSNREFTRYVADAGAAYVDVVLRGIFALKPTWAVNTPDELLDQTAVNQPRALAATLFNVRTIYGPAKVSVDGNGVRLTLPRVLKEGAPKTQEVAKRRGTI